jgi:small subunit ribosomal protein S1
MSENFAELFAESIAKTQLTAGTIVTAKVIAIDKESGFVTVTSGMKSEGVISIREFMDENNVIEVNVGDTVEVSLEDPEDGFGETLLSRERAKRMEAWRELERAFEAKQNVIGEICDKVKGGFTVALSKLKGFLPGSLVDTRPVRDTAYLEGKKLEFKIIKMDAHRNNIVLSRRAVVEEESTQERRALLDNLQEGQEVIGVVKNLTDYGAFIDLGGIDGLLHITDISWERVKHPSEALKVGTEIKVKVLKFDRDRNRVSLGMKQLGEDPWLDITRRYPVNTRLRGAVTNITDYGCFVKLEQGVEGLVHMSEMDWTNKNVHPSKVVQLGDEVDVIVLEIDEERRRISLGMKQCVSNPWEAFAATHEKGSKIKGAIKSITDFGVFIGLEGGIDGLVHLSDISWAEAGEKVARNFQKGQEVEAVILAIDPERERISLGIKQLDGDPFANYTAVNGKGSVVTGKIIEVDPKHVDVELAEEVIGRIRANELSAEKVDDATKLVKVGDEIEAKITNVDKKTRSITLSVRQKDMHEEKMAIQSYNEKVQGETAPATLGDLLKEKIEDRDSSD